MVVTGVGGSGQGSNGVKVPSTVNLTLSSPDNISVFSASACQIKVYCGNCFSYQLYCVITYFSYVFFFYLFVSVLHDYFFIFYILLTSFLLKGLTCTSQQVHEIQINHELHQGPSWS